MKSRVVSDVISHSGLGGHPRIILTEGDFERLRTVDDPIYVAGRARVISVADGLLEKPLLVYEIPDGIRLLQVSRDTLHASLYLGMAYKLTGEKKYAERLRAELLNVCSFSDWNPYHFLDVGEMCCAVGIGYDWIYECLTDEDRVRIRTAIVKNGIEQIMDDYLNRERRRTYRWYHATPGNNWKFVCNGGMSVAALAILDGEEVDKELLAEAMGYAYESTYRAIRDLYLPDGSYDEGVTYWNYATLYLAYYASALKSAAGTDYGLTDYEHIPASAYYLKRLCGNNFYSFNFGDAWEGFSCFEVFLWIGKNYGRENITALRADEVRKNNWRLTIQDLLWYIPTESVGLGDIPLTFGELGGTNASFRPGFGLRQLYGAIHFGDNNASHAHADMGTFIIDSQGRRFITELGPDNYNVKGDYRLTYRYRAEGHNTLVINPSDKADQDRYAACYIDRIDERSAGADMSAAYFGKKVRRDMEISEDGHYITVIDTLDLDPADTGYWFAHTRGKIDLTIDGKEAVITLKDGERMIVRVIEGGVFQVMEAKLMYEGHHQPEECDNSDFRKLAIAFDGGVKRIEVRFIEQ